MLMLYFQTQGVYFLGKWSFVMFPCWKLRENCGFHCGFHDRFYCAFPCKFHSIADFIADFTADFTVDSMDSDFEICGFNQNLQSDLEICGFPNQKYISFSPVIKYGLSNERPISKLEAVLLLGITERYWSDLLKNKVEFLSKGIAV